MVYENRCLSGPMCGLQVQLVADAQERANSCTFQEHSFIVQHVFYTISYTKGGLSVFHATIDLPPLMRSLSEPL